MRRMVPVPLLLFIIIITACNEDVGSTPTGTPAEVTATAEATAVETLAFIRNGDIWLIGADGANERQVTHYGGTDEEVVSFSWLNQDRLSYRVEVARESSTPPPSSFTAVLAGIDGTILWQRELAYDYIAGYLVSPDGELVAVWDGDSVTLEGIGTGVLWEGAVASDARVSVAWRPDGQLLSVRDDAGITVLDRAGQPVWTAASDQTESPPLSYTTFSGVAWSNDGRAFAFVDGEDIAVVAGEPLAEERLTSFSVPPPCVDKECPGRAVFGELVFAPDGQSLAVAVAHELEIGAVGNANFAVYHIDLGPPLRESRLYPSSPDQKDFGSFPNMAFSPDGRYLAYSTWVHLSACEGEGHLTVLHSDGSAAHTFVPQEIAEAQAAFTPAVATSHRTFGSYMRGFQWLPASDALVTAFVMVDCSLMEGERQVSPEDVVRLQGVYLVRPGDLSEVKLSDDLSLSGPVRSPSGRFAAHATGDQEQPTIQVVDIETRRNVDLGPGSQPIWQPQE